MKEIKENEIKRIVKEFLNNNYEKKYKVQIDVVLYALFGFEKAQKILLGVKTKTEQMKRSIESTKSYQFSSNRSGLSTLMILDPSFKLI